MILEFRFLIFDFGIFFVKNMDMEKQLKLRTKQFALRIIKLVRALPNNTESWAIGKQLIRSGTSVGANYRAACRARSKADFISKLGIVEEEVDESAFWLEIIIESGIIDKKLVESLYSEADEITAMIVTSIKSAKKNKDK